MSNQSSRKRRDPMDMTACTMANLRQATRALSQAYDAALQPIGLKATQFTLLATLAKRGDTPLTELARALVMDRTTLTRNLKPLEAQGLIRIGADDDRRIRRIGLTRQGIDKLEAGVPLWQRTQRRMVEGLGRDRWDGLLDDLSATVALARTE